MSDKLATNQIQEENRQLLKAMTFIIDQTEYGIDITDVRDIVRIQDIAYFPNQPHYIKGLINLRGKIIPTMDIGLKFNLQERPYDDRTCIVVIEKEDMVLGVIVDRINEVKSFTTEMISMPQQTGNARVNSFLTGIGKQGESHTLLLRTEKIMGHED